MQASSENAILVNGTLTFGDVTGLPPDDTTFAQNYLGFVCSFGVTWVPVLGGRGMTYGRLEGAGITAIVPPAAVLPVHPNHSRR